MAEGSVSTILAELLIVFLIVFTLVVEFLLHRLEHWVTCKHIHLQAVLRNLYRELMILGMISFGFVMYEIGAKPKSDVVISFEVAHFFIFLFAVFHTLVVMIAIFISLRLSYIWKKLEGMDLVQYVELRDNYRKIRDRVRKHKNKLWRYVFWWMPNPFRALKYWRLHQIMAFHDIRFQFIYYRKLPSDFRFSSFLRKINAATFIELVEIHRSLYFLFLIIVLLDIVRRKYLNFPPEFDPWFTIAQAALNAIVVSLLSWKIRRVYWKMTKHPATYYDNVNKDDALAASQDAAQQHIGNEGTYVDYEKVRPHSAMEGLGYRGKNGTAASRGASVDGPRGTNGNVHAQDGELALDGDELVWRQSLELENGRNDGQPSSYARGSVDLNVNSRGSTDGERRSRKASIDNILARGLGGRQSRDNNRQSIELVHAMPRNELADRHAASQSYGPTSRNKLNRMEVVSHGEAPTVPQSQTHGDVELALDLPEDVGEAPKSKRNHSYWNPSILKNAQQKEHAEQRGPSSKHPRWLVKLFPRLGRVASPSEKLFWFGSHRFFMWCVEWTIFFATIDVAVTSAEFAMALIYGNKKDGDSVSTDHALSVRAEKGDDDSHGDAGHEDGGDSHGSDSHGDTNSHEGDYKGNGDNAPFLLLLIALIVSIVSLFYVLLRIADIMRKYIFVLNNMCLVPESMTMQAIHSVGLKRHLQFEMHGGDIERGQATESWDNDMDDSEAARRQRSKYWGFFESQGRLQIEEDEDEEENAAGNGAEMPSGAGREQLVSEQLVSTSQRLGILPTPKFKPK